MLTRGKSEHRLRSHRPLLILAAAAFLALSVFAGSTAARAQTPPTTIRIEAQPVYQGCNSIVVIAPLGTGWSDIVNHFSDPTTVSAIWKYNNDLQRYQALYFPEPTALTDGPVTTVAFVQGMFVCVTADGTVG